MAQVGLVQINVDFSSEYLPYSAGLLQAFAQADPRIRSQFEFLPVQYQRKARVEDVVRALLPAEIVAFSCYVWNTNYCFEIARRLKKARPEICLLFGGPNVPDRAEKFLRQHSFIDFALHGEGEIAFREWLLAYPARDWRGVPAIRYLETGTGEYRAHPKAPRIASLESLPSPYLSGVFDPIFHEHSEKKFNVLWETNRGCPFSCTFCDWGSATNSKVNRFGMDRLCQEIDWFRAHRIEYLMCCDANFGIYERDVEIAEKLAAVRRQSGYPKVFAGTFTKNATERSYRIARILTEAGLIRGYTVSTQSVDPATLRYIKRQNISIKAFNELQSRFNRDGLPTYTDLIIGLPGETYESFASGVAEVVRRGQYNKIYFIILSLLPNAPMANPDYVRAHALETVWIPQKNLHEKIRSAAGEIEEYQQTVISTKTMSRADWRRTVGFAWMVSLVYFNKLLHIPLTVLFALTSLDLKDLTQVFLFDSDRESFPFFSAINRLFREKAASIQQGGVEYCTSPDWLQVWWQPDKLAFMEACKNLNAFYQEAQLLLAEALGGRPEKAWLEEAILLNWSLVRTPFGKRRSQVDLSANLYEFYVGILRQQSVALEVGSHRYRIVESQESWESVEDWCREVVWYGNKTSAYLSRCHPMEADSQRAGGRHPKPGVPQPYLFG